jgi:hypothetical protein
VTDSKRPSFDFSSIEMLASALHAQLLARRRATLEHDVKNVLHGLLSGTELLAKSLSTTSARVTPAECLTLLQQQLARAQTTFGRILDEIAPAGHASSEIDLAELVTDGTHALRHQLQLLNTQIDVPQGIKVRTSRPHLKNILLFVLLDCADRTPARGTVSIAATVAPDAQRATLIVRHTQDPSSSMPTSLTSIAPLLEQDDARLEMKGAAAGERVIELSLPLSVAVPGVRSDAVDLLFVDANRDAADSLVMLVQLEGFGAEACYDIGAAIDAVRARAPRAVIVDLDGSVDSRGLVRTIRSATGRQPRVIGLSHSPADTIEGLDGVLRKPLDLSALRDSIG